MLYLKKVKNTEYGYPEFKVSGTLTPEQINLLSAFFGNLSSTSCLFGEEYDQLRPHVTREAEIRAYEDGSLYDPVLTPDEDEEEVAND